jgi:hypothetical protein
LTAIFHRHIIFYRKALFPIPLFLPTLEIGMVSKVEKLASEIASLEDQEQQALWEQVADLNFSRGLHALSERYRKRLQQRGELDRSIEDILAELRQIREEIAAHDYQE